MNTVLVCGHGRCGSSLMMQMLEVGGYPVLGNYPAFEPEATGFDADMTVLLALPLAMKILDPQLREWPETISARVIWLDRRDRNEQAKSQIKMLRLMGGIEGIPDNAWRAFAASFGKETADAFTIFRNRGIEPFRISFEDILEAPWSTSMRIAAWLDVPMNCKGMAEVVIPRSPKCQNGIDIELSQMATVAR